MLMNARKIPAAIIPSVWIHLGATYADATRIILATLTKAALVS